MKISSTKTSFLIMYINIDMKSFSMPDKQKYICFV